MNVILNFEYYYHSEICMILNSETELVLNISGYFDKCKDILIVPTSSLF